jgi:23S rRNA (pseudouridine1915-N3)-methyltransferase
MKVKLFLTGKTTDKNIQVLLQDYVSRIKHYADFEEVILPAGNRDEECANLLKRLQVSDVLVLLDEKGKQYTSLQFSLQLNSWLLSGKKSLVFVIGGAYGFTDAVYQRADYKLSMSGFTFPHQLARLIFAEQLYRGFTILRNEKYHHE